MNKEVERGGAKDKKMAESEIAAKKRNVNNFFFREPKKDERLR